MGSQRLRRVSRPDGDLRFDRVGDKALFVGEMMEPAFICRGGSLIAAIDNLRTKRHSTDPRNSALIFGDHPDRLVEVAVDLKPIFGREI